MMQKKLAIPFCCGILFSLFGMMTSAAAATEPLVQVKATTNPSPLHADTLGTVTLTLMNLTHYPLVINALTSKSFPSVFTQTADNCTGHTLGRMNMAADTCTIVGTVSTSTPDTYTFSFALNANGLAYSDHTYSASIKVHQALWHVITSGVEPLGATNTAGTISPNGEIGIESGNTQAFTITPETVTSPNLSTLVKFTTNCEGSSPTVPSTSTQTYTTGLITGTCTVTAAYINQFFSSDSDNSYGMTTGDDGSLWFTEDLSGHVLKMDPITHVFTSYETPDEGVNPIGIAVGPGGNLWVAASLPAPSNLGLTGAIFQMNPITGSTNYYFLDPGVSPYGVVLGPDGNIWVTGEVYSTGAAYLASVNPATGAITSYYPIAKKFRNITVGPDGNLWILGSDGPCYVYQVSTSGVLLNQYQVTGAAYPLTGIVADRSTSAGTGNIWFSYSTRGDGSTGDYIGKIACTSSSCALASPVSLPDGHYPWQLVLGRDSNIWIAEIQGAANPTLPGWIGKLNPTDSTVIEYPIPGSTHTAAYTLTVGANGNIWFVNNFSAATPLSVGEL